MGLGRISEMVTQFGSKRTVPKELCDTKGNKARTKA